MYAFGACLRYMYANLSNIMLGISNSLFNYCDVTITLYAYILVCFLVPLQLLNNANCDIWYHIFTGQNYWGGGGALSITVIAGNKSPNIFPQ